jgi:hypothetical protein
LVGIISVFAVLQCAQVMTRSHIVVFRRDHEQPCWWYAISSTLGGSSVAAIRKNRSSRPDFSKPCMLRNMAVAGRENS